MPALDVATYGQPLLTSFGIGNQHSFKTFLSKIDRCRH